MKRIRAILHRLGNTENPILNHEKMEDLLLFICILAWDCRVIITDKYGIFFILYIIKFKRQPGIFVFICSSKHCGIMSILAHSSDSCWIGVCHPIIFLPCFVPTQIFVATIAFLLPGAEHSTLETDKKVCVGKKVMWNGWDLKTPWSIMLQWFSCRGMFLLFLLFDVFSLFSSPVLPIIN